MASRQWNDALTRDGRAHKVFDIVTWEGASNPAVANDEDGVIYMRGHGLPGSPFVTSKGRALHINQGTAVSDSSPKSTGRLASQAKSAF